MTKIALIEVVNRVWLAIWQRLVEHAKALSDMTIVEYEDARLRVAAKKMRSCQDLDACAFALPVQMDDIMCSLGGDRRIELLGEVPQEVWKRASHDMSEVFNVALAYELAIGVRDCEAGSSAREEARIDESSEWRRRLNEVVWNAKASKWVLREIRVVDGHHGDIRHCWLRLRFRHVDTLASRWRALDIAAAALGRCRAPVPLHHSFDDSASEPCEGYWSTATPLSLDAYHRRSLAELDTCSARHYHTRVRVTTLIEHAGSCE